jgi:hypothetical protein
MPSRIFADIARRGGGKLLNQAIDRTIPTLGSAGKSGLVAGVVGALAVRLATRSVPGAILVGGSLLAKTLYDRRQAKRTAKTADKPSPKP